MPAFSLYLKDDLLAAIRTHCAPTGQSVSSFIASACKAALYKNRPVTACVGKDGISWTNALPADDAARTQLAASNSHPGLLVYYLPFDCDTSKVQPGAAVPAGSRTEL